MATAAKAEGRAPGPTTVKELLAWPDAPAGEIVDGVWVPRDRDGVTGTRYVHGLVAAELQRLIANYARATGLGRTTAAETGFLLRRRPDLMRRPDVGFVTEARHAAGFTDGVFEGAPDLAVEVLSPSDAREEVRRNTDEYLRHGTRMVWVLDTAARTVAVHAPGALPLVLSGDACRRWSAKSRSTSRTAPSVSGSSTRPAALWWCTRRMELRAYSRRPIPSTGVTWFRTLRPRWPSCSPGSSPGADPAAGA